MSMQRSMESYPRAAVERAMKVLIPPDISCVNDRGREITVNGG